ncbi:forkhead transcription factor fkh1 [Pyrenophora tritici-repentis]|uniref:Forkhead transcription factor fkh1 n=2 Tax=Pyrenophora tritici-repentis TaxID=45151 RepID=A0A922NRP6_9PLEO|nr:fork head transcription factor 1 [Pyrenophora tritici-repentis Pt-1C-BFP]EDU39661.1 fork head transcription factor 1 [Pyrenophora tritici-repentis Pt-1C-BFP]KAI1520102.1 forkhead transcription factor fkh1 [Pyrenophora tritici-repentis]KAI1675515.1 forkhead transcription factor fkh1 [Pyrenophora tritici-repentis]KAI1687321.1 forkhead transcription factor fkh1 [Pyrenophora tritici-repentis]
MSTRRSGLRSRRDAQQQSDPDTPDTTPSRKRRRVSSPTATTVAADLYSLAQLNGSAQEPTSASASASASAQVDAPRTRITESVASNDSNTTLPNGGDADNPMDPIERQNVLIAALRVPAYIPHAAIDYANDLQSQRNEGKNITAFAKIAARDWCFFVQETQVRIGRADNNSRANPHSSQPNIAGMPASDADRQDWGVHIDLGPERQISRVHAEINFEPTDQKWYINVNSRNGLKLDDRHLTRGEKAPLHSGICISIMSTQMLFLLANTEDHFHPMLWRQVKNEDAAESDNDGNPPPKPHQHAHPGGPTPKREYYPFPPSSHPRHKHESSQASYNQMTSTPGHQPGTPMTFRADNNPRSKGSPANFPRAIVLESGDDIDYTLDSSKDIKPPHSYAQLIGQAILSSEEEMLTLAHIYDYIKVRYAYFRYTTSGWQNSIRHNLSLNKSFEKVARRTDEPGKGMKWKIADSEREEFIRKQLLNPRNKGSGLGYRIDGSGPSSPALGNPSQATERLVGALDRDHGSSQYPPRIKSPPRSATPPLSSFPMATESYTPDRGPRPYGGIKQSPTIRDQDRFVTPAKRLMYESTEGPGPTYIKNDDSRPQLESSPGVDPVKQSVPGMKTDVGNSPPTLYSDAASNNINGNYEPGRMNNALVTPLVTRHAPLLAPPSTAQMPSQYMAFSSPAPFWKFVDLGSTPGKGHLELSPIKLQRPDFKDSGEEEDNHPSSPPMLHGNSAEPEEDKEQDGDDKGDEDEEAGPESPSRTVSRPVSRREIGSQRSRSNSKVNGLGLGIVGNGGMVRGASLTSFEEEPEPEEQSYDLSKGFEKIGSFHRSMAQSHGLASIGSIGSRSTATPPPSHQIARTSVPANM